MKEVLRKILNEWKEAGLDVNAILFGDWSFEEVLTNSKTLRTFLGDILEDQIKDFIEHPLDYIDLHGRLVISINLDRKLEDIINRIDHMVQEEG